MTLGNSYGLEIYCLVCTDKNQPQRIYKYNIYMYIVRKEKMRFRRALTMYRLSS